ncbi:MAG: Asp-tRNA(Asn)/Glu-tRNA(Gln) amidotransferase subunit GatA, partial [Firmicutes bacterium]|nr:Asp-tRNA(Asn)/Glu-tRNA(Gln) amidotransferase subunit GatA [Bacillota bacterium]
LTPVAPTTAYGIGEKTDDPLAMYMGDVCTVPVNISGLPGLVVPQQLLSGLPCGVQLIGKPFGEEELFRAGAAIETERMLPELKGGC